MDVGDRPRSLPDDLIHNILSFVSIKHAVQTSVLSSKFRYVWTSMPCLNFSSREFHSLLKFSKFVEGVLRSRNNQIEVPSVELTFSGRVDQGFDRILNYAFSHNVQRLHITFLHRKEIEFPLSVFSSQSLKHLTFIGSANDMVFMTQPTWEMPALETLSLSFVTLEDYNTTDKCASLFSNLASLKNLTLKHCEIRGSDDLNICHSGLSSLTLENVRAFRWAPRSSDVVLISAPNLSSLHYTNKFFYLFQLPDELLHLENADICISIHCHNEAIAHKVVSLLQQLRGVKFLTVNLELIKLLSSFVELISYQPSPFANLKRIKIYPADVTRKGKLQPNVTLSTEVKNYLLDSSPGATFTMVSYEEIRHEINVTLARDLMSKLRVLLDRWKENGETSISHMKQDTTPLESHTTVVPGKVEVENHRARRATKRKWHFGEKMTKAYKDTSYAILLLQKIENVLKKLPSEHRAKLQVTFSSLNVDAETMDVMVDQLKTHCYKKSKPYFCELATASQPSS